MNGLWIQYQSPLCRTGSPTPTGNSATPAECPIVHLHSDTIYPEIASVFIGKRLSPASLPSTADANHKLWLFPELLTDRIEIRCAHYPLLEFD